MKIVEQCKTTTPKGVRYYHDGRRVTKEVFDHRWIWASMYGRIDTLHSRTKGNTRREYASLYFPGSQ